MTLFYLLECSSSSFRLVRLHYIILYKRLKRQTKMIIMILSCCNCDTVLNDDHLHITSHHWSHLSQTHLNRFVIKAATRIANCIHRYTDTLTETLTNIHIDTFMSNNDRRSHENLTLDAFPRFELFFFRVLDLLRLNTCMSMSMYMNMNMNTSAAACSCCVLC